MDYRRNQSLAERVGERVRTLRRQRGLTLGQVAERAQCGKGQLSRVENGRQEATLSVIERLAEGLDVSAGDLFAEEQAALDSHGRPKSASYRHTQSLSKRTGERLRTLRKQRGLTLSQVAVMAKCGKGQLSRVENGQQEATLSVIERLAEGLDVPAGDLFAEDPPDPTIHNQMSHAELLGKLDRLRNHPEVYALVLKVIDGFLKETEDQ